MLKFLLGLGVIFSVTWAAIYSDACDKAGAGANQSEMVLAIVWAAIAMAFVIALGFACHGKASDE